jgi:cysteine desulfuration protein SufE
MMMENRPIETVEKEIVEDFQFLEEQGGDRNEYLIDLGKKLPKFPEAEKKDENIIKGCQSTVWLHAEYRDGLVFFNADSNSVFVKGLISLLIKVLSGRKPDEIIDAKLDFMTEIGMQSKLSMNRGNGLPNMVKQMKHYALAYKLKNAGS